VDQHHGEGVVDLDLTCEVEASGCDAEVAFIVSDPSGAVVARGHSSVEMGLAQATVSVKSPQLWGPDQPHCYGLETELMVGGVCRDRTQTIIGLRSIALSATDGFVLNGRSLKLKGFCIKEDHGPLGTAIPDKLWRHKLTMLRDIGCNAIRCGHYPFSRVFYHLCDELGFLVMDEFCDGWDKPKASEDYGRDWHGNWQRDLRDMIRLHRNHPSIVFWSIGNEVHRQTDEKTAVIVDFVKELDDSRPVVMGRGYPMSLDATCFNGMAEKPDILEQFHSQHPDRPVMLTETPHSYNSRGVYRTRAWMRDPAVPHFELPNLTDDELFFYASNRNHSSYDNASIRIGIRECWKRTAEMDFVAGQFHWTFWDYAGESEYHGTNADSGEPDARFWPRGVVDMAMIRKDHSFYYESQFSDQPMVHLLPHWTHPDLADGTAVPVWAYTNADAVELWQDGESLGRQAIPAYGNGAWSVPYRPGTLLAIAYRDGVEVARCQRYTAGAPVALELKPDDATLAVDQDDCTRVECTARDAQGTAVPWVMNTVALGAVGPHRFLGAENGDRLDFTALRSSIRRLHFGQLAAFYGATAGDGPVTVLALGLLGQRYGEAGRVVHLALGRCQLREGGEVVVELRYTTDGSEPGPDSRSFPSSGLRIDQACTVRALALVDGEPFLRVDEDFLIGAAPVQSAATGHNPDDDQAEDGVRDVEAQGDWQNPDNGARYVFCADGTVQQVTALGVADAIARWWYDFPNDRDEDPDDHGSGEIIWRGGRRAVLKLTSRTADEIRIGEPDSATSYRWVRPTPT
jgi:beta-galactosidase